MNSSAKTKEGFVTKYRNAVSFLFVIFMISPLLAQDLTGERIRKVISKKTSIYFDRGIFHNGSFKNATSLKGIRHSYKAKDGSERIVFDFDGDKPPRFYGHVSGKDKIISIDFFDTKLPAKLNAYGSGHFIEGINFFPIDNESVPIELHFKKNFVADIFTLESKGRLVIDVRAP